MNSRILIFIEVSSVPNSTNIVELLCEDHTTTRKLLNIFRLFEIFSKS